MPASSATSRDTFLIEMTRIVTEDDARPADARTSSEVEIDDTAVLLALTGPRSERLKVIERELGIECGQRGNTFPAARRDSVASPRRRSSSGRGSRSARTTSRAR